MDAIAGSGCCSAAPMQYSLDGTVLLSLGCCALQHVPKADACACCVSAATPRIGCEKMAPSVCRSRYCRRFPPGLLWNTCCCFSLQKPHAMSRCCASAAALSSAAVR
ncbi:hypothetical protein GUJ93_ZPchr0008g13194 [Zizania palustris]|uniref:Uncharacterized protein n=1 Tax=Zizania palustris TaxID=103762 RepID=A0A8J5RJG6_ZIZPA|nr:hypothetical protein GUJ93_ZPchr0008g13194 [Zizania palustris]